MNYATFKFSSKMAQLHFHVQTITLHHPIVCSSVADENMWVNTKYAKFLFFLQNSPAKFHSFEVVWSLIVDSFGVPYQAMQINVQFNNILLPLLWIHAIDSILVVPTEQTFSSLYEVCTQMLKQFWNLDWPSYSNDIHFSITGISG